LYENEISTSQEKNWKLSAYTSALSLGDERHGVVYSARTGALIKLKGLRFKYVQTLVAARNDGEKLPIATDGLFAHLVAGGFVVKSDFDELAAIEELYDLERLRSEFMVTILPTFGCNLGCAYCFVGKKNGLMSKEHQAQIVDIVRKRIETRDPPRLSVDWFGGEPLLALKVIESLSAKFLELTRANDIDYTAQVITNGTHITDDVVRVLKRSQVDRLQITLDGTKKIHDIRRPAKSRTALSPFDETIKSLDRVQGEFMVRLRINVDQQNLDGVWELLDMFQQRGWLGKDTGFYPYLARISPFTDACASVAETVVNVNDFQAVNLEWTRKLQAAGVQTAMQGLYGFPSPKTYNCGAVGENALIFNPNGEIHKCGLVVDDSSEAIGHLNTGVDESNANLIKWRKWSPLQNRLCRSCEYLPSCLGGCPRNQMLSREAQKKENCTYYQEHESTLLVEHIQRAELCTTH